MSDKLTITFFEQNKEFIIRFDDGQSVALNVVETKALTTHAIPTGWGKEPVMPDRESFSVIFAGPAGEQLPQGLFQLSIVREDDGKEPILVFLVPIAQDREGVYYEAVFN